MKRRSRNVLESRSLRTRKRRRLIIYTIASIVIPVLIVTAAAYLTRIPFLGIKAVDVEGNTTLPSADIRALAEAAAAKPLLYFFSKNNILFYPKDEVREAVASSSVRIKSTEVDATGLRTIRIRIVERTPQAVWCEDQFICSYIDSEGYIYEPLTTSDETMFVFYGYTEDNRVPYVQHALDLAKGLSKTGFVAESMTITPEADAEIETDRGILLKVSLSDDPMERIDAVRTLMTDQAFRQKVESGNLAYIDLRFGNKVYYKAKGEQESAQEAPASPDIEQILGE